jgi:predicted ribosome quality control (RQC) complex YloA/Tae2 family protein
MTAGMSAEELEALRAETLRAIQSQRKRLLRRRDAITADLARIDVAHEQARVAALAVPTIKSVARGATSVAVTDYATGEPVTCVVALDPTRAPRETLDRIFRNARRLRNGEPIAKARLAEVEVALVALDEAATMTSAAIDEDSLIQGRVRAKLPAPKKRAEASPPQERKPPYRTFRTPLGDIWVGRGAAKNDELTFKVAKPYHLWLHVRGTPGAHVVVPIRRDRSVASETLIDAAHLAAHFSDARGERIVEVSYVPRKFVRKPRGSAPGLVTMEREKVLALRVDDARVEHLLKLESGQNE